MRYIFSFLLFFLTINTHKQVWCVYMLVCWYILDRPSTHFKTADSNDAPLLPCFLLLPPCPLLLLIRCVRIAAGLRAVCVRVRVHVHEARISSYRFETGEHDQVLAAIDSRNKYVACTLESSETISMFLRV